jgi:hypothetical protein
MFKGEIDVNCVRIIYEMTPLGVGHWFVVIISLSLCIARAALGWVVLGFLHGGVFTAFAFILCGSGVVVVGV